MTRVYVLNTPRLIFDAAACACHAIEGMMKRCVVFGANGFIGSNLSAALLRAGHKVIACDVTRDFGMIPHAPADRLETISLDFLDSAVVRNVVRGADWVFHLVSTTLPASSNANMVFDIESNLTASVRLLEACADAKVAKVVFASSGGTVYGSPVSVPVCEDMATNPIVSYGVIKLAIEKYCHLFRSLRGLRSVCLRLANPYGPRHFGTSQGAIPVFFKRVLARKPIVIWGDGSVVRDYVYVEDVANAFCLAAAYEGEHQVFNIGSGIGISLSQLLSEMRTVTQQPFEVKFEEGRNFDVPEIYLDISRARAELMWSPKVSLLDGLQLTWDGMLQRDHAAPMALKEPT